MQFTESPVLNPGEVPVEEIRMSSLISEKPESPAK